ncbi:MAG: archaeosortase/exosortase family protein [Opitutaceae bacterium]
MSSSALPRLRSASSQESDSSVDWRTTLTGAGALLAAIALVQLFPALRIELFARGAAELIGFFTGAPVSRGELGWMIPLSGTPVAITIACSATDFFVLVATLLAFQGARRGLTPLTAVALGLAAALPVALVVNAMRIITVAYAHPWLISRLPPKYESLLHMATGAAVFLPALIVLNLLLETYGNRHPRPARV